MVYGYILFSLIGAVLLFVMFLMVKMYLILNYYISIYKRESQPYLEERPTLIKKMLDDWSNRKK
jgi:hypothetical protein